MSHFPVLTLGNAPDKSRATLTALKNAFGFVPNIAGAMAASPELVGGFIGVFQGVHAGTFTEPQIQTLLRTNAVTNACTWAVAFHTTPRLQAGHAPVDVQAIRDKLTQPPLEETFQPHAWTA